MPRVTLRNTRLWTVLLLAWALGLFLWDGSSKRAYHGDEGLNAMQASLGLQRFRQLDNPPGPLTFSGRWARQTADLDPQQHQNYDLVNQYCADDAAPPLYPLLLHESIWAFGCRHTMWSGLTLNLLALLGSLPFLFMLSRRLVSDPSWIPFVGVWTFVSAVGTLDMLAFTRIYALYAFFCAVSLWLWGELLLRPAPRRLSLLLWPVCVALGGLTHYHFFLWSGLLSLAAPLQAERGRRALSVLLLPLTFVGFAGTLWLFPPMVQDFTSGPPSRTSQELAAALLRGEFQQAFSGLIAFLRIIQQQLFYPELLLLWVVLALRRSWHPPKGARPLVALALFAVAFWTVVALTAPFHTARYIWVMATLLPAGVSVLLAGTEPRNQKSLAAIIAVSFLLRLASTPIPSTFPHRQPEFQHPEQVGVIYADTGAYWSIWNLFCRVLPSQRYLFITDQQLVVDSTGNCPAARILDARTIERLRQENPPCWTTELPIDPGNLPLEGDGSPRPLNP